MVKKKTVSQLKKKADITFSKYIRLKYSVDGMAECVTCGVVKPWKEQQNGHYVSRSCLVLRYDERNAHVQCIGCNMFKNGNYPAYAIFMVKTYGPDILETLQEESKILVRLGIPGYEEIISRYKAKIEGLSAE